MSEMIELATTAEAELRRIRRDFTVCLDCEPKHKSILKLEQMLYTTELFRLLFGHDFTPERIRLIAEVTEQAIGVRDRWENCAPEGEMSEALKDFCRAVNAMEGDE